MSKTTYDDKQNIKDTTQYLWDKGLISAEIKDDKVIRRYVYLDIMPVAVLDYGYDSKGKLNETKVYSVHTDHLGTPKAITNDKQETVWSIEMDTFGETKSIDSKNGFEFNLRFAGQYYDDETGYHYNYHRYYNPETGRYLTSDPILNGVSFNTYAYVDNEVWGNIDPYGLLSVSYQGITTFRTQFHLLPKFSILTPKGWKDYANNDKLFHVYNMMVEVSGLTTKEKDELQKFIVRNPTPNNSAEPATYQGTHNPASPNFGAFAKRYRTEIAKIFTGDDDVISYTRKGINGLDYVINVTKENHSLRHGIVIRGLECKGNSLIIHNYGEGDGILQSVPMISNPNINEIWYWASEYALESVTKRSWKIKGEDWTENGEK